MLRRHDPMALRQARQQALLGARRPRRSSTDGASRIISFPLPAAGNKAIPVHYGHAFSYPYKLLLYSAEKPKAPWIGFTI